MNILRDKKAIDANWNCNKIVEIVIYHLITTNYVYGINKRVAI